MGTVRYTVIDGEVIAEKRNGVRKLYVPDPLGSTVALLDNTQAQTDTFTYWPYGEDAGRTGTTPTPFQYLGTLGYYQDNSNRNYVRARHLRKDEGRWLNQDPAGFNGGDINLYGYAYNNPLAHTDSLGLKPSPKPGIGKGDCPGKDAVKEIRKRLNTHTGCATVFKYICNGHSLGSVLSQIQFVVRPNCDKNKPKTPCQLDTIDIADPGNSCQVKDICISSFECNKSKETRANDLLFELGNWCNCKYHKLKSGEVPTQKLCIECGFSREWCDDGGIVKSKI